MVPVGPFAALSSSLLIEVVRLITGRLFTEEQIRSITSDAIGKHFADLFPTPEEQRTARERIDQARLHIEGAGNIIAQMQQELSVQSQQLVD